ncbi:MAG: DNA-processing protein DprA [Clostridia bacterium]|nr:DNA-processing protein DprA [Clostridia bacterium]
MKDENILYWLWLSEKCAIATKDFRSLAERFEDPFELYRLETEEIEHIEGISERLKNKLSDKSLENAYSTLKYCKDNKVNIISYRDERYPKRLKDIENPPVLLYVLGELPDFDKRLCIGVVGTRSMSDYGKEAAFRISYELAAADAVIVSGMALGIDAVSAAGALEAGGVTVAVLGCGIARTYPKEHVKLKKAILKRGAVISEYPPFEAPNSFNFPKRNRIISGLSGGVVIVEGSERSGALITAAKAISQGRELFALPGNVDSVNAEGPNELIKSGANVVLSSEDVIDHYDFLYHDVINYREYSKAKKSFAYSDRMLKKYGIGAAYFKKKEEQGAMTDVPEVMFVNNDGFEAKDSSAEKLAGEQTERRDDSAKLLEGLDDTSKKVFELLPIDKSVSPDALTAHGMDIGEVITALTMLEISGLISSLPGGLYIRK